jgi:mannose-1-phosphate guanylyltransferase/phosphomannomutase
VFPGDIGDIDFPPRTLEYYVAALQQEIDTAAIRGHGFKAVIDYAYGSAAFVMPNVLSKLGTDVLAVNPYASTPGASSFDRAASADAVATLVRTSGAHVGAVIDPGAEHITLIDDEGHVLTDTEALLAFVELVTSSTDSGCRVAVPVIATSKVAEVAAQHGAEVVWTKVATSALMQSALDDDVALAASCDGGFIVPHFLPAFDAMATFAKLLELLARTGTKLSKIVAGLPRTHVVHETVATPWEQKGTVMRSLMEQADGDLVLIDGVKMLFDDGWVLTLPDPEVPVTHVWAEAGSDGDARRRAQEHVGRIRRLLG